jgi:hypothetical protein
VKSPASAMRLSPSSSWCVPALFRLMRGGVLKAQAARAFPVEPGAAPRWVRGREQFRMLLANRTALPWNARCLCRNQLGYAALSAPTTGTALLAVESPFRNVTSRSFVGTIKFLYFCAAVLLRLINHDVEACWWCGSEHRPLPS